MSKFEANLGYIAQLCLKNNKYRFTLPLEKPKAWEKNVFKIWMDITSHNRDTHTLMLITALFTIAELWSEPWYTSTDR
jgi:hypothetical protein